MIGHAYQSRCEASLRVKCATYVGLVAFVFVSSGARADEQLTELKVGPMDCPACGVIVRQSLQSLDGVQQAVVSASEERVNVTYDDDKVSPGEMVSLLSSRGYNAEVRK